MKLSLSTNWCNRRLASGEAIADLALAMGFDELELGFHTTPEQVKGFKARRDAIPVGSVHAFCPVPISAPQGYPELYALASLDADARKIAQIHVRRNVAFAADVGADTLVLHAGRAACDAWFARNRPRKRAKNGAKLLAAFRPELEALVPLLEEKGVTLALENLPYPEGFPNETELDAILGWGLGDRVKGWFDTGHDNVRRLGGFGGCDAAASPEKFAGMHLNDSVDGDDHLAPGDGRVDFAALKPLAERVRHCVFEPGPHVSEIALRRSVIRIREMWEGPAPR